VSWTVSRNKFWECTMKQKLNFIVPLTLLAAFVLTACELSRPGDEGRDIGLPTPEIATPGVETPPTTEAPTPPDEPQPADISRETSPAPVAPDAVEPGQVLIKLNEEAGAIMQTQGVELGTDNEVVTGIGSLNRRLQEIGASELVPVLEDVADVLAEEDLDSLSAQAEQVGRLYSVSFSPDQDPVDVAQTLGEDPSIEFAEPNYIAGITGEPHYIPASFDPNDQFFGFQWHMQNIQMPLAWDLSTGQEVVVAVIDTGIDFSTPDMANTKRRTGYDFANDDTDATDDHGHGTHVAGTIAQSTNNGTGVTGVAFDAQLLPVKALGSDGNGSYANIIKGITFAVKQGAKVINMSLAGRRGSQALQEAVQYAHSQGVIVVAAAGNSNGSIEFPAAYDDFVIAVGATRLDNTRARYSNFGPELDLVAPGGDVNVDQNEDTYGDGVLQQTFKTPGEYTYLFFEGTSMASPHVAGLAALILSRKPSASPADVESLMVQTALGLGPANEYGAGLIQAFDALAVIAPVPDVPTSTPTSPPVPATDTPTATSEPVDEHEPDLPTSTPTPVPITPTSTPTAIPVESPTNTPTPTPAAPLPPAGQLLLNGDFEGDQAWLIFDTPIQAEYDTSIVFDGNRSIRLGNPSGPDISSYTSVRQKATIPTEATQVTLTANIYPISQDVPGRDVQVILILDGRGRAIRILDRTLSNSQTWEPRTYDLSDLAGQTIFVYFGVYNRGGTGKPSAMYVDNVSLTWAR
jgi:serine protease